MKKHLKAGVSIVDISPGKGLELAGYPHHPRCNTGIHDPLYAGCIYLDDGKTKLAIVSMDLLFYSKKYVNAVRKKTSQKTGIPEKNIMICCSHTHSGPWASGRLDLEALEKGLKPDSDYIEILEEKLVSLITDACSNPFYARVGVEKGYCGKEQGVGGNRRNPGGPSDPDVWTVGVQDANGNWKAVMVEYALHPTVIHADSTAVSADYPAYIRRYFSRNKPGAVVLFAQGTSGDQSTRYFRNGQTFEEAERIGTAIAIEADRMLDSMSIMSEVELSIRTLEVDIGLRTFPDIEVQKDKLRAAKNNLDELISQGASYIEVQNANLALLGAEDLLGYIIMMKEGRRIDLLEDEVPPEIQVIGIGDARMVCLPGEVFVEFGLDIKSKSPYEKTFVIELANGCLPGYVYTREALAEGGYETDTSLLSDRMGDILVQASVDLLNK